jgi:transcriptional regulator with XRE-family HTH domain
MKDTPSPTSGADLANLRKSLGVRQADIAEKLGIGRVSLHRWENAESVDAIRAARYRRAVEELYRAAVR